MRSFITAIALSAAAIQQALAAPLLSPINVDLPTVKIGARVLVGDPTCPVLPGGDVNLHVFAAVRLHEVASVSVVESVKLPIVGTISTETRAKVEADVGVCLCLNAAVDTNLLDLSTRVSADAKADITAYLRVQAVANAALSLLTRLLGIANVKIDVSLTPVSKTNCACPANARPTCSGGQCGCETCPSGQLYNSLTGSCGPTPSGLSSPIRRRLSTTDAAAAQPRQARRADVVKRIEGKTATKTVIQTD